MKIKMIMMILTLLTNFACSGGGSMEAKKTFTSIRDVPDSVWNKLSQQYIYFGHQSVGFNIIDGIKDVLKDNPKIQLNIMELPIPPQMNHPQFAHSKVGKNRDPKSKCFDFSSVLENGIGSKCNIAMLKLCYVDVLDETNVDTVFSDYKDSMAVLKKKFPNIKFIHMTAPLTSIRWKHKIKNFLNMKSAYEENIRREEFNHLMRQEYKSKEPFFDLAEIESTFPDGSRASFDSGNKTYFSLVPEYTSDGGHLNERGRRLVAEQLLILLANVSG